MKKSKIRILAAVMAMLLLLPMLPLPVRAQDAEEAPALQSAQEEQTQTAPEPEQPVPDGETLQVLEPTDSREPMREAHQHKLYINGDNSGAFRPNASLTRAELAKIIYSLGSYPNGTPCFSDVSETAWYAQYVYALSAQGILQGFEDGSFRPNSAVTRVQVVTILQRISGLTTEEPADFTDVSETFWGYEAIAVAQSEGWVSGYPDGSFCPNRAVTRAEAVTILNRYLGRVPDTEAIDANPYLHFFPDVTPDKWYYYQVMEASINHSAEVDEEGEHWLNSTPYIAPLPDGFYCINRKLYLMLRGVFLHTAQTGVQNGVTYSCEGESGVCTAKTQVLILGNSELIFLKNETPEASPGYYANGFYVRNGQLYVARNGWILHKQYSGTLNGVSYTCQGSSGICTTPDWSLLPLSGINLKVFTSRLTGTLKCSYSDVASGSWYYTPVAVVERLGLMEAVSGSQFQPTGNVTHGQALKTAVKIYEAYFQVDAQPFTESEMQHYLKKAREYGILESGSVNYSGNATRGDVVSYLYRAFRGRELGAKNTVDYIPDVEESNANYTAVMAFYKAGIMKGTDDKGTALLENNITRAELATLVNRLVQTKERLSFSLYNKVVKKINYGTSGSGKYYLQAIQVGEGKNVMVLSFAVHGWEDHWAKDGSSLVYLADKTKQYLEDNYHLLRSGDWTVYILRCVNPDGLMLGTTNDGPGRCTTTYYDESGVLRTDRGIDINRCFDYKFEPRDNDRNFNGSEPLACEEARALASFVKKVKGKGNNVLIDTHGWLSQIITSSGKGAVYKAFERQFPDNSYSSLLGASGYFSAWAAYRVGYDSCLFELPMEITSHEEFLNSGCIEKFEAAIKELLSGYRRPPELRDLEPEDESFVLDGN